MEIFSYQGKKYHVDESGFLLNREEWDRNFAEGIAREVGVEDELTEVHWNVIDFIRSYFKTDGRCPLVYTTCRENGLSLKDLKWLFPAGYLRGACRLAGLSYREAYVKYSWVESIVKGEHPVPEGKAYRVDVRGFLIDPSEWDENFAIHKAHDLKMPEGLTERHWEILRFLRERYEHDGRVPTIYETCETFKLNLDDLETLFPDGYHRGAVKIAGLRFH